MTQKEILLILHFVFIACFVGGQFFYLAIVQPASYKFFSANEQTRFLQNILKLQNPILLLMLCLAVLSGGFMITPIKSALGADYFSAFGSKLIYKLGLFFIVFFVTAYQTLSVGFRIRFLDPAHDMLTLTQKIGTVRTLMTVTSVLNIGLMIYIIFVARHL